MKIALVGNTNAGKTTFLNTVCGVSQKTSNYPGTTVELFKAKTKYQNREHEIIDLPGTYSLTPFSEEEKVTRKLLLEGNFDLVVQVIEPKYKKRAMAFTLELMEMGVPLFIVINNKNDIWKQTDCFLENLKKELAISGVSLNALKKESKKLFFEEIKDLKIEPKDYKNTLKKLHLNLEYEIETIRKNVGIENLWLVLKTLEKDQEIIKQNKINDTDFIEEDRDYCLEIRQNRFQYLEENFSGCSDNSAVKREAQPKPNQERENKPQLSNLSNKIDTILLNKWLGIPIFLFLMWIVFQVTFTLGAIPMDWIDSLIGSLQEFLAQKLPGNLWSSVLIDGIIGGVGATLVFLPPILLLFFFLSILQQSGYLARTAYLLDSIMRKIGLGGKSFVPLLMGFGCSVPAIMATRTLTSRKEKIITSMMVPFMSCGAKLPVYTLFISAFFKPEHQGNAMFALYVFGILMGILSGLFFNKIIKDKKRALLLEMPDYTLPKLKNVWKYVWNSGKAFLRKAGMIILPLAVVLWFLFTFPLQEVSSNENNLSNPIEHSYAAQLGKTIEPVFKPLGFDWRISTGLIAGLGAKEVFVSTFGTMYSLEEEDEAGLIAKLQNDPIFTPLSVISLLIFVLIYTPCVAVIGMLKQELGTKWALIGLFYPTMLAWIISLLIYQIGLLIF